jgi:hypothetical protein
MSSISVSTNDSRRALEAMLNDASLKQQDLEAGRSVSMVLLGIVTMGLTGMMITVLLALLL